MTVFVVAPLGAFAQSRATVGVEENFRRAPNDVVLARLEPGTPLTVVRSEGSWTEVDLEGWIWLASLQASEGDLDLVVSVPEGENLRSAPQGGVLGRLEEGALLEELAREPGWAHVRRRGWIWSASLGSGAAGSSSAAGATTSTGPVPNEASVPTSDPSRATARRPEGFATAARGAPILTAPDGDTLAVTSGGGDLEIVSREGNWARVRLDGWIWMPATTASADDSSPSALVPEDVRRAPEAYIGRVVAWTLQFVSLEEAEELRTDFRRGEPFMLTRYGGPDGPFVYVAVPPEREAEVAGVVPLEMITVTARIRTGASALTGTPIVDLVTLEKGP